MSSLYNSRLNTWTCGLFRHDDIRLNSITANVVVLIPPPQLLGAPPINISMQKNNSVKEEKSDMSNVLKPALRVVKD